MQHGLPHAPPGRRIGLLGGSFDPPHAGHLHITQVALRRLGLDQVWWLVSPGNPLKPDAPAEIARRMAAARALVGDRRVVISDLEARLGTRFTADTLAQLRRIYPAVTFVWLMGADNLATFHRWDAWDGIMETVPVAVMSRPGAQLRAGLSPAARRYARWRLPEAAAGRLTQTPPPAWVLLTGPMVEMSSTWLRQNGAWQR